MNRKMDAGIKKEFKRPATIRLGIGIGIILAKTPRSKKHDRAQKMQVETDELFYRGKE